MKEVKDVKNVDKVMSSVAKGAGTVWYGGFLIGFCIAVVLVMFLGAHNGLPLEGLNVLTNSMICGAAGSTLIAGGLHVKHLIDKKKLKTIFEQVKTQTGIELEVEEAQVALEKTDLKTNTSYDTEKTHSVIETEVVKRFYMLDKNEQMQVLEFVRKTVKDHMGKTKSQSLSLFEEEDKKAVDYVGVKKELKFIPKTPITKED